MLSTIGELKRAQIGEHENKGRRHCRKTLFKCFVFVSGTLKGSTQVKQTSGKIMLTASKHSISAGL